MEKNCDLKANISLCSSLKHNNESSSSLLMGMLFEEFMIDLDVALHDSQFFPNQLFGISGLCFS